MNTSTPNKPAQKPAGNHSPYGKGFAIRMIVLLGLLALALGGYFYDRQVMIPTAEKKIDEVEQLINEPTDDGQGIPPSLVEETIGGWASKTSFNYTQKVSDEKLIPKEYEVHQYTFKRVLPFLKGQTLDLAFMDKALVFSSPGKPITEEMLQRGFETSFEAMTEVPENIRPSIAGGGGGGGGRGARRERRENNTQDDEGKDEDEKSESKEEKKTPISSPETESEDN